MYFGYCHVTIYIQAGSLQRSNIRHGVNTLNYARIQHSNGVCFAWIELRDMATWVTNKLFHASKNIDAKNNWFMALKRWPFCHLCSFFFSFFSSFLFSLSHSMDVVRLFDICIWMVFFARSFPMVSSMCAENTTRQSIRIGSYQTIIIFIIIAEKIDAVRGTRYTMAIRRNTPTSYTFWRVDNKYETAPNSKHSRNANCMNVLLVFSLYLYWYLPRIFLLRDMFGIFFLFLFLLVLL